MKFATVFLFALACCHSGWTAASGDTESNILMVGNSYTARNNLRLVLEKLLEEGTELQSTITQIAVGGARFANHVDSALGFLGQSSLRQHLISNPKPWDYVILQEQSQIPGFIDYRVLFESSENAAVQLYNMAIKTGAQPIFYVTWGRRDGDFHNRAIYPDFKAMQTKLTEGYNRYAEACMTDFAGQPRNTLPPLLAPIGPAFEIIYNRYAELGLNPLDPQSNFYSLYSEDGSHPSRQGTYLAALVMYSTITGKDPRGLSYTPSGISNDEREMLQSVAALTTMGAEMDPDMMVAEMESIPVDSPYPTIPPSGAPSVAIDEGFDSNAEMCDSLVLNSDMEFGGEGYWYGHGVGSIRDVSPGYDSATAIRSMERHRYWDGPGYMINMTRERQCMVQGSKWLITAQVKLIDPKTEGGATCSLTDSSPTISCPQVKFRLRDRNWKLSDYVIKGYTKDEWDEDGFNKFHATFSVPGDSDTWQGEVTNVAVFFHMYHPDLDLVIDDFNIVKIS